MDTKVLLANSNKRYDAIFQGLGILNKQAAQSAGNLMEAFEVAYNKLVEVDNKLDAVMAHFGIELSKPDGVITGDEPVEEEKTEQE